MLKEATTRATENVAEVRVSRPLLLWMGAFDPFTLTGPARFRSLAWSIGEGQIYSRRSVPDASSSSRFTIAAMPSNRDSGRASESLFVRTANPRRLPEKNQSFIERGHDPDVRGGALIRSLERLGSPQRFVESGVAGVGVARSHLRGG